MTRVRRREGYLPRVVYPEHGIAPITGVLTDTAAPLPSSLVLMYTTMAAIGILVYLSVQEERWENFVEPVVEFLGNRGVPSTQRRTARAVVLIVVPLVAGWRGCRGKGEFGIRQRGVSVDAGSRA